MREADDDVVARQRARVRGRGLRPRGDARYVSRFIVARILLYVPVHVNSLESLEKFLLSSR